MSLLYELLMIQFGITCTVPYLKTQLIHDRLEDADPLLFQGSITVRGDGNLAHLSLFPDNLEIRFCSYLCRTK